MERLGRRSSRVILHIRIQNPCQRTLMSFFFAVTSRLVLSTKFHLHGTYLSPESLFLRDTRLPYILYPLNSLTIVLMFFFQSTFSKISFSCGHSLYTSYCNVYTMDFVRTNSKTNVRLGSELGMSDEVRENTNLDPIWTKSQSQPLNLSIT